AVVSVGHGRDGENGAEQRNRNGRFVHGRILSLIEDWRAFSLRTAMSSKMGHIPILFEFVSSSSKFFAAARVASFTYNPAA
ncbi:MAG TPA: hypothetical protein VMV33_16060, partial [Rhodocyclaceae bacterium]|nr:hypothetical protein [Rhodocyclaceae bacterium]